MAKDKGGRPPSITKDILNKLEQGFVNDLTDEEACLYAGISPATLYNYQNKNPEFIERKRTLKRSLGIKAKETISKAINKGDKQTTKWWLERKRKDEFSARSEHTGKDGGDIPVKTTLSSDDKALLDRFIAEREKS